MSKILLTRPNHDPTTTYLYYWSEAIIDQAKASNHKLYDLKGKSVTKFRFTCKIRCTRPQLVIINGHGDVDLTTGYDNQVLVQVGINESILKNKIVYARSCSCAKKLGPACVAKGTIAFIGYDDEFVFMYDENSEDKPKEDETAALFLEPSNQIAINLLKGLSTEEANKVALDLYHNAILSLSTSEATPEDTELLPYLYWDMTHQKLLGDKSAMLNIS